MPGHEIVGRVVEVGADVTRHAVGDMVGVGCMVDSCGECEECRAGSAELLPQRGDVHLQLVDRHGTAPRTYGGYSGVDRRHRGIRGLDARRPDPAAAAPILCAGITMYSPLRHHDVGPGTKVGVAGFGGLGGMAVKLAKALGAEVTVITRSDRKADDARKAGADDVLVSSDRGAAARPRRARWTSILSTIPTTHDLMPYLRLLKRDGSYVVLGAIEPMREPIHGGLLAGNRVNVTGSMIGGIPETQEVLDFCAEHGIASDVQVIGVDGINAAYDDLAAGDPGLPLRHRHEHPRRPRHDRAGAAGARSTSRGRARWRSSRIRTTSNTARPPRSPAGRRQGKRVVYCLATRGEAGIDSLAPAQAGPLREAEQRASAAVVGVDVVEFLGYPDGTIEYGLPLRRDVARAVRRHRPDVVITGNYHDSGARQPNQADHIALGGPSWTACATRPTAGCSPNCSTRGCRRGMPARSWSPAVAAATHGVDVTDTFDAGVASLQAHAAYLQGLGDHPMADPREFLESFARSTGSRLGTRFAVAFEAIDL